MEHIPTRFRANCEICKKPLDVRAEGVHQRTSGWVKNREDGGGHGVSLPDREPLWAHGDCVYRVKRGWIKQEKLL